MKTKRKQNIGLIFDAENQVPRIAFKGNGLYADYIEKEFRKNKSPERVVRDEELLSKLSKLPVESEISTDLYGLVAILLIHVYSLEVTIKRSNKKDGPN
ncbi:MAG: hypothetical protein ACMZ63_06305 [Methylotenera sp.]